MIKISLDTSCICLNNIYSGKILDLLKDLQKNKDIQIYISPFVIIEKKQFENIENKEILLEWIKDNTLIHGKNYTPIEFNNVGKIHKILFPTTLGKKLRNSYIDYRNLMYAILNKADYFLHNNPKDFENEKIQSKEKIEKLFSIKIRKLNDEFLEELIKELNENVNNPKIPQSETKIG